MRCIVLTYLAHKILRDRHSWYVTFKTADSARRAQAVVKLTRRTLANHMVTVTARPAPTHVPLAHKTKWTEEEMLEQAETTLIGELRKMLEKDVTERVLAPRVARMVLEQRGKAGARIAHAAGVDGHVAEIPDGLDPKYLDRTGLRGLSFRKKRTREELTPAVSTETVAVSDRAEEEEVLVERPKKKLKKSKKVVIEEKVIESEDEDATLVPAVTQPRKRAMSEASDIEVPVKKKVKPVPRPKKKKVVAVETVPDSRQTSVFADDVVHEVLPGDLLFEQPSVAQVRVTPYEYSPSPAPLPAVNLPVPIPEVPAIDPVAEGICEDDEDMYFAKLALERMLFGKTAPTEDIEGPELETDGPRPFRKHLTGSARTEGYYKIPHTEKSSYVAQYALRGMTVTVNEEVERAPPAQKAIATSRSNRANARRRAQGLEEMNMVQRAMALSKGEAAAPDSVKYNQLQTRKKHLRFARSPIHDWGLYAMERISRGDLVVEYVGEVIRAQVADKREKAYERQGIGSSYLFRIDEDLVVDATKKGNLGYVFLSCVYMHDTDVLVVVSLIILATRTARRRLSRSVARRRS